MASIAGHEQEQQGRGQMKRKQVTAIITAAILAVTACLPVSSISAIAAEAGAEAEAATSETESAAIESEDSDEAEVAAEAPSDKATTEESSNDADAEAPSNESATEASSSEEATEAFSNEVTAGASSNEASSEAASDEAIAESSTEEAAEEEAAETEEASEEVAAEEAAAEGDEENLLEDFSISLNATELELHVGETFQLELTVNDGQYDGTEGSGRNYEVGWSYDDTYLLDAYDGLVVAKHAGTEVVTAVVTVYEGWEKYIYRASCTVTIPYTTEGQCGENLYFDVSEAGVLTISGTGEMYDYTEDPETIPCIDCRFNSIVIEEGVTSISGMAFRDHDELTSVTFYPGLESLGVSCFDDCMNLADVYFQGKITEWRDCYGELRVFSYETGEPADTVFHVFDTDGATELLFTSLGCVDENLRWAVEQREILHIFGSGVVGDGDEAYVSSDGITKTVVHEGVTAIGDYGVPGGDSSVSIQIPVSVKSISAMGLGYSCLKDIYYDGTISQWVDKDGQLFAGNDAPPLIHCLSDDRQSQVAFYQRGNLKGKVSWIVDDKGVLTISGTGAMVFKDSPVAPWNEHIVKKAVIKSGVTSIARQAFLNFTNMTSVSIPNTVTEIGFYAFDNCGITSITIPKSVEYFIIDSCPKLKTVKFAAGTKETAAIWNCPSLTTVTIPSGVQSVGNITNCKSLKTLTIPDGVLFMGNLTGCSALTSLSLPDSVNDLGECRGCTKLASVKLSPRMSYLCAETFRDCKSLKTIDLQNVTLICQTAFKGCSSLTTITVPIGLNKVEANAFNGCTKLAKVNYKGTAALWKKIKIERNNDKFTKAKRTYKGYTKPTPDVSWAVQTTSTNKRYIKIYFGFVGLYEMVSDKTTVFRILRKSPGSTKWTKVADVKGKDFYNDYSVKWGTYIYTVRCMNNAKTKYISDYNTKGVTAKTWLATPNLTSVTNTSTGVSLKWRKSAKAQKFRVFRKIDGGSWQKLTDTAAASFVDKTAKKGKKYSYRVRCITSNGKTYTSEMSAAKTITRK
ncbi:MAG: leucine-rich repeat protein [Lachnospiraceae bacterium]|nr:leucine-rich repeat protein [Lachnospiraceae bacterium]